MRSSLETPSTSSATGLPKRSVISSFETVGVLDHVVQQRGAQRLGVELPLGEDLGDRERVRDVGLAALAVLALVGGVAEVVGLLDAGEVGGLEVAGDALPAGPRRERRLRASRQPPRSDATCTGRARGPACEAVSGHGRTRGKGHGSILVDAVEQLDPDLAGRDLAQRDDGRLVRAASISGVPPCASWRAR